LRFELEFTSLFASFYFANFLPNHKLLYHIYKELELNLRIKPCKHLVREKPEALTVPKGINQVWSMDFMDAQLQDGRTFRVKQIRI